MNCSPKDILKKQITGSVYTVDSPELELEFVQYLIQKLQIKVGTASMYLSRSNMQDNVAITLQEFIYAKTDKMPLISDLKAYKYLLIYEVGQTSSFVLRELRKEKELIAT